MQGNKVASGVINTCTLLVRFLDKLSVILVLYMHQTSSIFNSNIYIAVLKYINKLTISFASCGCFLWLQKPCIVGSQVERKRFC